MWIEQNNALVKTFTFPDFKNAFAFMLKVAMEAEKINHHPTWTNIYNRVEIRLNSHDAGDIVTERDHSLAKAIDKIYAS